MKLRHYLWISCTSSLIVTLLIVGWGLKRMLILEKEVVFIISVTLIASLVGFLVNFIFLSHVFRSFRQLKKAIQTLPNRTFQKVKDINSPLEFKELADSFNDMSDQLKEMFDSLEESEKDKNLMIAQLSHDIKTPITSIQATTEGMLDGIIRPEEFSYYLKTIRRQTDRLNSLVTELNQVSLDLKEVEEEEVEEVVFIDKLLIDILSEFQFLIDKEHREIAINVKPNMLKVISYREKLSRILLNLVSNAFKYSEQGSSLEIDAMVKQGRLIISVIDEGKGIPEAELGRIFKRLYRVESSRNMATGGHGLGLYIAQELAKQLGGFLSVSSVLGKGSCFTLELPYQSIDND